MAVENIVAINPYNKSMLFGMHLKREFMFPLEMPKDLFPISFHNIHFDYMTTWLNLFSAVFRLFIFCFVLFC